MGRTPCYEHGHSICKFCNIEVKCLDKRPPGYYESTVCEECEDEGEHVDDRD